MGTIAPNGDTWEQYCKWQRVKIDPDTGTVIGAWAECLAWAKAFEIETPDWASDPRYAEDGPCGQVINAIVAAADQDQELEVQHAAERFESQCDAAVANGHPLPLIDHIMAAE